MTVVVERIENKLNTLSDAFCSLKMSAAVIKMQNVWLTHIIKREYRVACH